MSKARVFLSVVFLSTIMLVLSAAAVTAFPTAGAVQDHEKKEGAIEISDETDVRLELVKRVNPAYPPEAKEQGIVGKVICRTRINKEGKVAEVEVEESPNKLLTDSTLEAIRQWEWKPPLKDGESVEAITTITINFQLK